MRNWKIIYVCTDGPDRLRLSTNVHLIDLHAQPNFRSRFKLMLAVQMEAKKYFVLSLTQIKIIIAPFLPERGALRGRHEHWAGMRWTWRRRKTNGVFADGEVVWS